MLKFLVPKKTEPSSASPPAAAAPPPSQPNKATSAKVPIKQAVEAAAASPAAMKPQTSAKLAIKEAAAAAAKKPTGAKLAIKEAVSAAAAAAKKPTSAKLAIKQKLADIETGCTGCTPEMRVRTKDALEDAALEHTAPQRERPKKEPSPKSKRLQQKRASRLNEAKFGTDEAWADRSESADEGEDDFIVDEEEAAEESSSAAESEEAVASGEEEGGEEGEEEEEEEEEEEAEEAKTGFDKIVGEKLVDGVLRYRLAWHGTEERTWADKESQELQGPSGALAIVDFEQRKARRAAKAKADLEEALSSGWAVPVGARGEAAAEEADSEDQAASGDEAADEGAADAEALWVQCEKCDKWRRLLAGTPAPDEETAWFCSMNPDEDRNTCEAEEESMPEDGGAEEEGEEAEAEDEAAAREVESIRARRETAEGEEEFRVRWRRCTWEEDSWVPRERIPSPVVSRFLEQEEARKRAIKPEPDDKPASKKKRGASFVRS